MTIGASGRLFRSYSSYCKNYGPDSLFQLLTALHSLNDQLRDDTGDDLHTIMEFVALKALRNHIHHGKDILANVRLIPTPAISDVVFMCLLRRDQVELAIEAVKNKTHRSETRTACETMFHWYGQAVNINPCIFNVITKTYELLIELKQDLPEEDLVEFEASYRFEKQNGLSHYVDGYLSAPVRAIEGMLSEITKGLPPPV
jgi:hypothetical protein